MKHQILSATGAALTSTLLILGQPTQALAYGEGVNGFPNWEERVLLQWTNRARVEPSIEMTACNATTTRCADAANNCYQPIAPLVYDDAITHAARFHSANMSKMSFFSHNSKCTLNSSIATAYPSTCDGSASCACQPNTTTCTDNGAGGTPVCTSWSNRVKLFGPSPSGEIIASSTDPNSAFYQWLYESFSQQVCAYVQGPPTNGHRWNLLKITGRVGFGVNGPSVGDFAGGGTAQKIPSGSHYPRQAASVDVWANWYDTQGPAEARVNVDGTCVSMTRKRGTPTNGAYSATLTNVSSGCHRYYFIFKDSAGQQVTYPTTGSLGIGPASTCADFDSTRPAAGAGCACAPSCSGKTCGDNGCGGSCGTCGSTQTCNNFQCVNNPVVDAGPPDSSGNDATTKDVSPDSLSDSTSDSPVTVIDSSPETPVVVPDSTTGDAKLDAVFPDSIPNPPNDGSVSQRDAASDGAKDSQTEVSLPTENSSGCDCQTTSTTKTRGVVHSFLLFFGFIALRRLSRSVQKNSSKSPHSLD